MKFASSDELLRRALVNGLGLFIYPSLLFGDQSNRVSWFWYLILGFEILPTVTNGGWYQVNGLLILFHLALSFLIGRMIWLSVTLIRPETSEPKE